MAAYNTGSMMNTGSAMYSAGQAMNSGAVYSQAASNAAMNSGFCSQGDINAGMVNGGVANAGMVRGGASRGCCGTSTSASYNRYNGGMAYGPGYGAGYGAGPGVGGSGLAGQNLYGGPGSSIAMTTTPGGGTVVLPPSATGDGCGCGPPNAGECTGSCGGAETMCCEPEGAGVGVNWVKT
eukprot:CAMPEP_0204530848 /NCGR_PEP_ID=MMETSP0661-20131031/10844_1 /ASSEMBLY_ACC=CAM_ASM_000606 /TAXON_ID=109239 /ORGANISM="Alexandrium margalefi, Strain AMGDE01CS-322" /LENGTH=179 /DNA_ID=CAMNT_0051536961 /DNA_START=43 /DNA_END=578 /DNA_ORIENTATION=-